MKKLTITILIVILSLAIMTWWGSFGDGDRKLSTSSNASDPVSSMQNQVSLVNAESTDEGAVPPGSQPASTARRIAHIPQGKPRADKTRVAYDDLSKVTAENFEDFAQYNLTLALTGDLDAGRRIADLRLGCLFTPKSQEELERNMQRTRSLMQSRHESNTTGSNGVFERILAEQSSMFKRCRKQAGFFDDNLRTKLDQLAQQGNVAARFMYATWPLDYMYKAEAFMKLQEWEAKAAEYSFLNLEQGEAAGLLAFAYAYSTGDLFTSSRNDLSLAFFKAASDCGPINSELQNEADGIFHIEGLLGSHLDSLSAILEKAEHLSRYCR